MIRVAAASALIGAAILLGLLVAGVVHWLLAGPPDDGDSMDWLE